MMRKGAWTMVSDAKGVLALYKLTRVDWPNAVLDMLVYSRFENFAEIDEREYPMSTYWFNVHQAKRAGRDVTHVSGKVAKDLLKILQRKLP